MRGNLRPVTTICDFSSSPLAMLYWVRENGAQRTHRDSLPSSNILLQLSFTAATVGQAGAEISPPCSRLFLIRCRVLDCRPSSLAVSILGARANSFTTCPPFEPGTLCS